LAQQRMTWDGLKWPFHGSSVPSVWEGRALKELNARHIVDTKINIIRIACYLCGS